MIVLVSDGRGHPVQKKRAGKEVTGGTSRQWKRDELKESFWRKHISAWKESGQSKRGYCLANNLSESALYAWMRRDRARDRGNSSPGRIEAPLAKEVTPMRNPFVPLQLLPDGAGLVEPASSRPPDRKLAQGAAIKPTVDIIVPGGAVLRVDESCGLEFIVTLFSTLKGLPQC